MNIFDLFIYAIVAIVLVTVFLTIAQNFPPIEDASTMIKQNLDVARLDPNLGKLFLVGTLNYKKEDLITSTGLTPQGTLTLIECTNPEICCIRKSEQGEKNECEKAFEWDYDYLKSIESRKVNTFVRCVDVDKINTCKVYIGLMPAQARVMNVENIGENNQGNTEIKTTLTNSGKTILTNAIAQLKLFKEINSHWVQADYEVDSQEIQMLQPGEEKILYWEIKTQNPGNYQATIIFEANNGGFDQNSIEFNKTQNTFCKGTIQGETIYNAQNDNYEELYHCEGCNYAHECANAWSTKNPKITYYPKSRDYAYCIKNSLVESC
ncbi:MAG: hypothetical protein WC290_01225 [archaeon]|jgi:hypothetical protein